MAKKTKVSAQINLSKSGSITDIYFEGSDKALAELLTQTALKIPAFEQVLNLAQLQIREAKAAQG